MHIHVLLLQIAAVLVVGRVLGRVVRGLGQPLVIAEILAGIALGPSLLGLVWPEATTWLFPPESLDLLGTVAQLGLVFFMFLVGLEFDPRLLEGRARSALAISGAGIVAPMAVGVAVGLVLPATLAQPGVPRHAFALFVGVSMSVTAFPVLARILTERRLVRTPVGSMALAAAAVDDVAAWCLLALLVGITSASGVSGAAVTVGAALAYSAVVWFLVRPVLARLGPRRGNEISVELMTAAVLLVVLSALITEAIGVHALFGGFLIGAAMPRTGGLATALAEKTEDFVTIVLLPLFFAFSGLRTQIGLLDGAGDWALMLLLLAVATLGKFGGSTLAARLTGLGARESVAVGVLMNTRGLMELVVLNVGLDLGVISGRMFTMMVVVAIVTTWTTTPVLRRVYAPAVAGGAAREAQPALPPPAPAGVMICVSDPQIAGPLVRLAAAVTRGTHEPLWVVHLRAVDRPREYLMQPDDRTEPVAEAERVAAALGVRTEVIAFPSAEPAGDLVRIAAMKHARLVFLGTHRSSFGHENLRGVTGGVLRDCTAAVGILQDRGLGEVRRIGVRADDLHGGAVVEVAERLRRGGATVVDPREPTDLLVQGFAAEVPSPAHAHTSVLLVRAPLRRAEAPEASGPVPAATVVG